jgi:hypothetical protein
MPAPTTALGHGGGVEALAWSDDALFSSSTDGTVKVRVGGIFPLHPTCTRPNLTTPPPPQRWTGDPLACETILGADEGTLLLPATSARRGHVVRPLEVDKEREGRLVRELKDRFDKSLDARLNEAKREEMMTLLRAQAPRIELRRERGKRGGGVTPMLSIHAAKEQNLRLVRGSTAPRWDPPPKANRRAGGGGVPNRHPPPASGWEGPCRLRAHRLQRVQVLKYVKRRAKSVF